MLIEMSAAVSVIVLQNNHYLDYCGIRETLWGCCLTKFPQKHNAHSVVMF